MTQNHSIEKTGLWSTAPLLTGTQSFSPLSGVHNILVTGGEGFIGSWLVRHLVLKYPNTYNVVSFDRLDYSSSPNNARLLAGKPNFSFFRGDVTDTNDVMRCLDTYSIDTVFHLAAQTHVDNSFDDSYPFVQTNVTGTHVLLECLRTAGKIMKFYHISTDEVYGEVPEGIPDVVESCPFNPTNPYAASKAAAECFVRAYMHSYKIPAVVVRMNNVYGPHQYPEKVIPKFITLLQGQQPLCIYGNGQHVRRYIYAGDVADALDTLLHRGKIGETYNIASTEEISSLNLARRLSKFFDNDGRPPQIEFVKDRPFHDSRYAIDGTKLYCLGWKPRVSWERGLAETVEWYKRFGKWWDPEDLA